MLLRWQTRAHINCASFLVWAIVWQYEVPIATLLHTAAINLLYLALLLAVLSNAYKTNSWTAAAAAAPIACFAGARWAAELFSWQRWWTPWDTAENMLLCLIWVLVYLRHQQIKQKRAQLKAYQLWTGLWILLEQNALRQRNIIHMKANWQKTQLYWPAIMIAVHRQPRRYLVVPQGSKNPRMSRPDLLQQSYGLIALILVPVVLGLPHDSFAILPDAVWPLVLLLLPINSKYLLLSLLYVSMLSLLHASWYLTAILLYPEVNIIAAHICLIVIVAGAYPGYTFAPQTEAIFTGATRLLL